MGVLLKLQKKSETKHRKVMPTFRWKEKVKPKHQQINVEVFFSTTANQTSLMDKIKNFALPVSRTIAHQKGKPVDSFISLQSHFVFVNLASTLHPFFFQLCIFCSFQGFSFCLAEEQRETIVCILWIRWKIKSVSYSWNMEICRKIMFMLNPLCDNVLCEPGIYCSSFFLLALCFLFLSGVFFLAGRDAKRNNCCHLMDQVENKIGISLLEHGNMEKDNVHASMPATSWKEFIHSYLSLIHTHKIKNLNVLNMQSCRLHLFPQKAIQGSSQNKNNMEDLKFCHLTLPISEGTLNSCN